MEYDWQRPRIMLHANWDALLPDELRRWCPTGKVRLAKEDIEDVQAYIREVLEQMVGSAPKHDEVCIS